MTHGITRRQSQLLGFIAAYIAEKGWSPTFAEMATELGIKSKGQIAVMVAALEERGHVSRIPNRAASIRVVDTDAVRNALRFRSVSRETSSARGMRDGPSRPVLDTAAARGTTRAAG